MIGKEAQLVFPGFRFGLDDPDQAVALVELGVGGFCLYGGQPGEIARFTRKLQNQAKIPLLFCADYEEGLASQVRGATRLPSQMGLGAADSLKLAFQKGEITAVEARALGVRWILAPVVDLATAAENPIVNIRAFSDQPEITARLARAYIRGLRSKGVLSCLKHFPGHGDTTADSHLKLPLIQASRRTLWRRELRPFRELSGIADSIMLAHLRVPALEKKSLPSSLSVKIVDHLLRRRLGYTGLVATDALSMRAIAGRYEEDAAAVMALKAGSDILLVPENPRALVLALSDRAGADPRLGQVIERSARRLQAAKRRAGLFADRGIALERELGVVACAKHARAALGMAQACLAWAGPALAPPLSRRVFYCEADGNGPRERQGSALREALKSLGVELVSDPGRAQDALVACFLRPRAYAGFIRYPAREISRIKRLQAPGRRLIAVSFGSPFVLKQFSGLAAGLCAFSSAVEAQRAAAQALTGKLKVAGRMPVAI